MAAYGQGWQRDQQSWQHIEWVPEDDFTPQVWYDQLYETYDFQELGVFVFEPGNTSGFTKLPPQQLMTALARICAENQIVTVVDEVTCGIGRTGKWFGFMQYDLKPEIIAVGKGLGNGYPVSAVIMNQKTVVEAEQAGFQFAQSHQNDPMGARVAYEVIEKIENAELLRHTQVMGEYLRAGYKSMQKDFPIIREIRGIGLLNSIELDASVSEEAMREIDRQFFEHGIIAGVKPKEKVIRTYCPLIVTKENLDVYLKTLSKILQLV